MSYMLVVIVCTGNLLFGCGDTKVERVRDIPTKADCEAAAAAFTRKRSHSCIPQRSRGA